MAEIQVLIKKVSSDIKTLGNRISGGKRAGLTRQNKKLKNELDEANNDLLKIENANIIDIRENYLYMLGHIKGSVNISEILLSELYDNYLDKNKTYYIYCSYGRLSKILANKLNNLGYHVYSVDEGYNSFKNMLS